MFRVLTGRRPELLVLIAFAAAALIALALLKLTSEIAEGETSALDIAALQAIRTATQGHGALKDGLRAFMLGMTALGNTITLAIIVLAAAGILSLRGHVRRAISLLVQTGAGALAVFAIKAMVDRPRPDVVAHLASFSQASFPSGHAANSTIVFLALGMLLATAAQNRRQRLAIMLGALALAFLIGLSRLYAGVHWPTDVLGGWAFGAGWTALGWAVSRVLRKAPILIES